MRYVLHDQRSDAVDCLYSIFEEDEKGNSKCVLLFNTLKEGEIRPIEVLEAIRLWRNQ